MYYVELVYYLMKIHFVRGNKLKLLQVCFFIPMVFNLAIHFSELVFLTVVLTSFMVSLVSHNE